VQQLWSAERGLAGANRRGPAPVPQLLRGAGLSCLYAAAAPVRSHAGPLHRPAGGAQRRRHHDRQVGGGWAELPELVHFRPYLVHFWPEPDQAILEFKSGFGSGFYLEIKLYFRCSFYLKKIEIFTVPTGPEKFKKSKIFKLVTYGTYWVGDYFLKQLYKARVGSGGRFTDQKKDLNPDAQHY